MPTTAKKSSNPFFNLFEYLHNHISHINNSKIFAGLMIITLNISSKFVTIKLSKTMESYLKYTFSRDILVFAIAWMGTRDVYIAMLITLLFVITMDFLLNEDSMFCVLPEQFTNYHVNLLDSNEQVTDDDVKHAQEVLDKAKKQKEIASSEAAASTSATATNTKTDGSNSKISNNSAKQTPTEDRFSILTGKNKTDGSPNTSMSYTIF